MIKMTVVLALLLVSFNAFAKNPGENAKNCISTSSSDGKITFTNNCGENIFVLWCGDLKYTKKHCGDGPKGGFYTQSANIDAYGSTTADVKGQYEYASCKGSISFGNDGTYKDFPDGSYQCLKR